MEEITKLRKYFFEEDLKKTINYFFDIMNNNKKLRAYGHLNLQDIKNSDELNEALEAAICIATEVLKKPLRVSSLMFNKISEEKFYHGICTFSEHKIPVLVLYFSDIQVGIATIAKCPGDSNNIRFYVIKESEFKRLH